MIGILALLVLGGSGWVLPSMLEERTFACNRVEARCELDVARSFFGREHERFSLSEIVSARDISREAGDDSSWEAIVDTKRGARSLGRFKRELECRAAVRKVLDFLSGSGERFFFRDSRSAWSLAPLFGIDAFFGFVFLAGLLGRASLCFEWDANRIQIRRRRAAFWRRPVYFDLKEVLRFEIREKSDGDGGTHYSVVLVSRKAADAELWTETSKDRQLDFAQDLNEVLAQNRRAPVGIDPPSEVEAAPLEESVVEGAQQRSFRAR
jgi:hypothetical protein